MDNVCNVMENGEILNENKNEFPIYEAVLYGDKTKTAKLSKRVSCAIKHLPIRVKFEYVFDTLKSIEAGVRSDPTLVLDGEIFVEGLTSAEEITQKFEKLIKDNE